MANLFDYIAWRGDIGFDRAPFNAVDNIVFSQLSYLPMDGIVPGPGEKEHVTVAHAAVLLAEKQHTDPAFPQDSLMINSAVSVLASMGTAPRYQNCELLGYVNHIDHEQEKQFSAFSAVLDRKKPLFKKTGLVVFRGTDLSLVGWKEDLNMSFNDFIPSQKEAVAYLDTMAGRLSGPLMVAGHSKGGNLAIYAAAFCGEKIRRRITVVYSDDAPGFARQVIESEGYQAIRRRIYAFVPQQSVVGMILEHGEKPAVIKSTASGAMQHDLCTWEVNRSDIVRAGELSQQSRLVEAIMRDWISEFEPGQQQQFVDAIYKVIVATNAQSISDLTADWFKSATGIIKSFSDIDKPARKLIVKSFGNFIKTARKNMREQQKK